MQKEMGGGSRERLRENRGGEDGSEAGIREVEGEEEMGVVIRGAERRVGREEVEGGRELRGGQERNRGQ